VKRIHTRILVHTLGLLLALILVPLSSLAQVPHDTAYQGRLTDAVGAPLVGLVDLQLRRHGPLYGGPRGRGAG